MDWRSITEKEDPAVAIQILLIGAAQKEDAEAELSRLHELVVSNNLASKIDALATVPVLLPLPYLAATALWSLISLECSAKELVIAIQERAEAVRWSIQLENEDSDDELELSAVKTELSLAEQSIRLLEMCGRAIPRLRKGKMSSKDALAPMLTELKLLILANAQSIAPSEIQLLLVGMDQVLKSVVLWAKEQLSDGLNDLLYDLVKDVVEAYAKHTGASIAIKVFHILYPRLVRDTGLQRVPDLDAVADSWYTLSQAGISIDRIKGSPSVGNLILLVHSQTELSLPALQAFLPFVIMCTQTNNAIEEALTFIMRALPPRADARSPLSLTPELATVLTHLLAQLASAHPDATLRHITFRVLGHALWLTPPRTRLALLADLLADADTPAQMHVAGVGLVREAVVEALGSAAPAPNVFASPAFVDALGPVVFRPRLSGGSAAEQRLEDFLQSPEPSRLVEVFALLFLVLQRDVANTTGMRSQDSLRMMRKELLQPVHDQLEEWHEIYLEGAEEAQMRLGILEMWVERVSTQVDQLRANEGGVVLS
ncbi:hypothetical protein PHLGIDRAFT_125924 [Phlebiopsis gigantea 11061_1 CR5-6]|uniref:Uncharacterized protein n=1 Tax=Phlebiopsis gigantea (strain 11061_1 CR5-6) TaxID=745531 RepID=A0A0C3NWY3_PHLG1|nr:hypothetical protein PHLGIDRAFT_125924 [Phlebiopsis gigantea 11061_1 CR5-6]